MVRQSQHEQAIGWEIYWGEDSILKILRLDPIVRWFSLSFFVARICQLEERDEEQGLRGCFLGEEVGTEI